MKRKMNLSVFGLMVLAIVLSGAITFANETSNKNKSIGKKISAPAIHPRSIKVIVSKNGFSPSTIEVEKGHAVNLVFYRADKQNCGSEVVFPKLKIRKSLPVKKAVAVTFTPKNSGEITFTCGMGMYKGKIVVAE